MNLFLFIFANGIINNFYFFFSIPAVYYWRGDVNDKTLNEYTEQD